LSSSPLCLFCVCSESLSSGASPTEIYPLSLHDALPICGGRSRVRVVGGALPRTSARPHRHPQGPAAGHAGGQLPGGGGAAGHDRSEEHTSELQSRENLVCRLLLEKKKTNPSRNPNPSKS